MVAKTVGNGTLFDPYKSSFSSCGRSKWAPKSIQKGHFWDIIPLLLDAVGDEGAPTRTNIIQKGAAVTAGQKGAAVTADFYLKHVSYTQLTLSTTYSVSIWVISVTFTTDIVLINECDGL